MVSVLHHLHEDCLTKSWLQSSCKFVTTVTSEKGVSLSCVFCEENKLAQRLVAAGTDSLYQNEDISSQSETPMISQ